MIEAFDLEDSDAVPMSLAITVGDYIDERDDLDAIAIGRGNAKSSHNDPQADGGEWDSTQEFDDLDVDDELKRHKEALSYIPPDCSYEIWIAILMSLHAATGGSQPALRLVDAWSRQGQKYKKGEVQRLWGGFKADGGRDEGTLFHWAKEYGWNPHGPKADPNSAFTDDMVPPESNNDAEDDDQGLRFKTADQCGLDLNRPYVVKNFIAPGQIGCVFGDPGAGKSLLGPDMCYRVALGYPVFNQRTKPGLVFYVAAEDPTGLEYRVRALRERHGHTSNLELVGGVSDLFTPDSPNLKALAKAVKKRKPKLMVIDTLAMAFPGLEENDAKSMARVVAVARALASWGAAVILIHHGTKADGTTPRGHSVLNGALDVAVHLKPRNDAGNIYGRLTKNRNGTCDLDVGFTIGLKELGRDDDGEMVRAAYAEELPKGAFGEGVRLTRAQRGLLSVLDEQPNPKVPRKDLLEVAAADDRVTEAKSHKARMDATRRAMKDMIERGVLQEIDGLISRVNANAERARSAFGSDDDQTAAV